MSDCSDDITKNDNDYDVLVMSSDNLLTSGAFMCLCDLSSELIVKGVSILVVLPCFGMGEDLLRQMGIPYIYVLSDNAISWL